MPEWAVNEPHAPETLALAYTTHRLLKKTRGKEIIRKKEKRKLKSVPVRGRETANEPRKEKRENQGKLGGVRTESKRGGERTADRPEREAKKSRKKQTSGLRAGKSSGS